MNLADMLNFADIGQLTAIAGRYQCDCKRNSKHDLIQSILITLGSRQFMESHIRECAPEELRFLNTLLFDERSQFSLEDLLAAARQASFDTDPGKNGGYREMVARFKNAGWLFRGASQQSRYLFRVPQDLKLRFRERMGEYIREQISPISEPAIYRSEGEMLAEDLLLFMRYVRENEPELNQEGAMHKRYQQGVMNAIQIPEPLLGKGGWKFGYGRACEHYPPRLALMVDYARHRRYTSEEGFRLRLTLAGETLLEQEKSEKLMQIYAFWLKLYKGAIPNLPSLIYWISVSAGKWVTVASLVEGLGWLVKPFYYDDAASILEQRILRMLLHLGMLRLGETPEGPAVMMTPWGMEAAVPKQLQ
ncbi:hypothetical protein A3844_12320 [Paenibacillus helianthi]|uniref:Helicase XPB/Ssl2 N-terminal domain-containing protein n=1 Tax=Paenibacillus helianthi TaxID=1349432 RepID=A0ABX3ENZ7_9BACL|nr:MULTISPECIES: hypothetical protein [Paenibacillus]OKP82440.1 hypothetical protein A3842_09745 [Paenibacillus sp. P3E]OKP84606.1 hypothetical protein A3848_24660 [Paenibacillus sp. P32E]OKP86925.1 hypothetical protein A3844_12320 [Paenibacillus helianthi]